MNLDVHLPAIIHRDATAFGDWMAAAEPRVRRSLASFAARVDVEAVLQDALLRAWIFAHRVVEDGRENSLLRYTLRVAHNLAIDELRRRDRANERYLEPDEEVAAPEVPTADPALAARLADCVEALPPQPRQAFLARSGAVSPDRALADRLGMQLNTFLKNVGRARKALIECLQRAGVAWEAG